MDFSFGRIGVDYWFGEIGCDVILVELVVMIRSKDDELDPERIKEG